MISSGFASALIDIIPREYPLQINGNDYHLHNKKPQYDELLRFVLNKVPTLQLSRRGI